MRLTVTSFLTLDGVSQSPGAPDEDASDDFDLGGWLPPHVDKPVAAYLDEILERATAFLLGRRTYDIMAACRPCNDRLDRLPKYVATTRTDELTWSGARRLDGEVGTAVTALKDRPGGELQVHGSGALVQSLMAESLVDAYHLLIVPVILGHGRRLFAEGVPPAGLRLAESRSASGVLTVTYECAGGPRFGTVPP